VADAASIFTKIKKSLLVTHVALSFYCSAFCIISHINMIQDHVCDSSDSDHNSLRHDVSL